MRLRRAATILSLSAEASAQLGYQWALPQGVVAAFAGFETRFDGARGIRHGMRLQAEAWLRPDEDSLVHAVTVAGTAQGSVWTRIAWGYRLWDTYLGPRAAPISTPPATERSPSASTPRTSC